MKPSASMREASDRYWRDHATGFAAHYDRGRPGFFGRFVTRFLEERARLLDGWLRVARGAAVLDAGCGDGVHLVGLARQGAVTTGIDVSAGMLALTRERLKAAGVGEGTLIQARLEDADLAPGSFDLTLAIGLLDYVADWREALARLGRLTRPGGQVIVTIPKRPSPFFVLRRGPGLWLRRTLFHLPPVLSVVNRGEFLAAAAAARLTVEELRVCQAAMWAARCRREA